MISNVIYGDCLEVMKDIPDKSIDLVLTDPPYNVDIKYENYNDKLKIKDYKNWCKKWFHECLRISKCILITIGYKNINMWYEIQNPYHLYIWYKNNQNSPSPIGGFNIYEIFLIYGKPYKRIGQDGFNMPIGLQKSTNGHPVPKYLKAWEKVIKEFTNENDIILDCFAGSGTTAIACLKTNRKYICIEKEKKYIDIIHKRIKDFHNSISLIETVENNNKDEQLELIT